MKHTEKEIKMEKEIKLKNEAEVREIGIKLGQKLLPGSILALEGELGTGKTSLTRYIGLGLGITRNIKSPTFTILNEYRGGRLPLYHFDVYRIDDPKEMEELGYEEYFFGEGITVLEWADKIKALLPDDAMIIRMGYGKGEEERIYRFNFDIDSI